MLAGPLGLTNQTQAGHSRFLPAGGGANAGRPIAGGGRVGRVTGPRALGAEGTAGSWRALHWPLLQPRPRHARRCLALGCSHSACPRAAAPGLSESQRDGGSHGAGARQPSPGRCHVQLGRRRRLSGAGHPDGHAGGARAAPAAPGGTCREKWGRGCREGLQPRVWG